jgi:hypothetical protein
MNYRCGISLGRPNGLPSVAREFHHAINIFHACSFPSGREAERVTNSFHSGYDY